jgi:hypothetical protein
VSKPIIFSENSQLLPLIRQKVDKLRETLINDKLAPWRGFNFYGVNITDFYGKPISISGGGYNDSTANVFFDFIKPFLEDAIVKTLDEKLEICSVRGLNPKEPYIREAAMVLEGHLICPIYDEMVDIDRHLRSSKGNLKSIGRRDVTDEIAEMNKFLDKCKDEMIQGIKAADLAIISELIKQGESHTLEFKEIPECNTRQNRKNNDVLFPALKTIAGFLNAEGGTLLIGVDDSGKIRGIDQYLNTMKHGNNDTFEQQIGNCLRDRIEPHPIGKIKMSFKKFPEGTICRVDVQASKEHIHLDDEVYVRDGNTTQLLKDQRLTDWIQQRSK